jgi:hypothetical protein
LFSHIRVKPLQRWLCSQVEPEPRPVGTLTIADSIALQRRD